MSKQHAQIGDTIQVTKKNSLYLWKKVIVVAAPNITKRVPRAGDAWAMDDYGCPKFLALGDYEIVCRGEAHYHRKEMEQDRESSVDAFLKKQLYDNLHDVFC